MFPFLTLNTRIIRTNVVTKPTFGFSRFVFLVKFHLTYYIETEGAEEGISPYCFYLVKLFLLTVFRQLYQVDNT